MPLPIRQNLELLAGLNRTQHAVLLLVVELAENGGKGHCDATNDYLCKRTQATPRTVTRTLAELQRLGLVVSGGHTTRRQIMPTAALRVCYASASKTACAAATEALGQALSIAKVSIDKPEMSIDNQGVSIDNGGQCLETTEVVSIDIQGSRVYGDDQNDQLDDQDDQRGALALAQKKNEELAEVLAEAQQDLITARQTISSLRADLDKLTKELVANRVGTQVSELPFASAAFAAVWHDHCLAKGIAANSPRERAQLAQLLKVAPDETLAIEAVQAATAAGWSKFYTPDEPRTQPQQPFGAAQHGQRTAPPVHANPFGIASPASLALATAIVVGGQRGNGVD